MYHLRGLYSLLGGTWDVIFLFVQSEKRHKGNNNLFNKQMKVAEIVFLGRELLKMASENDVRVGDWKYIDMYNEYVNMRKNGIKYRATICELAVRFNTSRSNVERIVRRFQKEC